jgi:outer membrane translocation and assembly module TamA
MEYRHYVSLRDGRLVLAGRGVSEWLDGDEAPFFELPYLELRGYPRGAVRDDVTLWGEIEARYDLFGRIGAAVFGGVGWVADSYSDIFAGDSRWAGGFGLRYNLRPQDRLKVGMDVAWATDGQAAIYLRVGEAF